MADHPASPPSPHPPALAEHGDPEAGISLSRPLSPSYPTGGAPTAASSTSPARSADDEQQHQRRPPIGVSVNSMRAGTQTLIQALSAVPWDAASDSSSTSSSSDGDEDGLTTTDEEADAGDKVSRRRLRQRQGRRGKAKVPDQELGGGVTGEGDDVQLDTSPAPQQEGQLTGRQEGRPRSTSSSCPSSASADPSVITAAADFPADHPSQAHADPDLKFPFPENTIARHARPPGKVERTYERAKERLVTSPSTGDGKAGDDSSPSHPPSEEDCGMGATERTAELLSSAASATTSTGAQAGASPAIKLGRVPHGGPRMRDQARLLGAKAGDKKVGHVVGGLSGQMEDIEHEPISPSVDGSGVGSDEERQREGEHRELDDRVDHSSSADHQPTSSPPPTTTVDSASSSAVTEDDDDSRPRSRARTLSPANSHSNPASLLSSHHQRQQQESNVERWRRKAKLAEKLRLVFGLEEVEQVVNEMGCWLLRSVYEVLQGHMYVTTGHILFYAHMPEKQENKVLKNGPLVKKSKRHLRGSKFWFVLKNGVLTWFVSSADPYFPHGNVDLSTAISCEAHPSDERTFRLVSRRKKYSFQADTAQSRDEWVKAIQKSMFRVQHEGENVKIAIPYETILEVEKSETIEFAESIEIKVLEGDEEDSGRSQGGSERHNRWRRPQPATSTFDSYFFACFHDIDGALDTLRQLVDGYHQPDRSPSTSDAGEGVRDSTMKGEKRRRRSQDWLLEKERKRREGGVGSSLKAHLRHPFASPNDHAVPPASIHKGHQGQRDEPRPITHTLSEKDAAALTSGGLTVGQQLSALRLSSDKDSDRTVVMGQQQPLLSAASAHTYPPPPAGADASSADEGSGSTSWLKDKIPSLLNPLRSRTSTPKPSHSPPPGEDDRPSSRRVVRETIERNATSLSPSGSRHGGLGSDSWESSDDVDLASGEAGRNSEADTDASTGERGRGDFYLLERSETDERQNAAMEKSFHEVFAMDKDERLLENFSGYLFRVIPVAGRVYISTNHFCFRSSQLLTKTRMVIPISDIIALQPQKAFRFGHHGLAIIIKGHEELFMEFSSAERRDACKSLLDKQADELKRHRRDPKPDDPDRREARILQDLDESDMTGTREMSRDLQESAGSPRARADGTLPPPVMFTSGSSSFLDFKPKEPMHITCLTIGSRGDVQPYIALCKGLQAEGHTVRIASHGEYREWIEGHGIEFGYVGGDPAELMRICVENGMFTVSFIKEGLQKFRDWIDDLLVTSWFACQGTDLLIESPSAMGGLHIAEGLAIPYFRAFTMPWTRTRAYPHAFAVPEGHRGGSYNYMTYTMFDQVFWRAISSQVNSWRKKTIGIAPTTLDRMEQHKVPFLYNFSPTVVPPPLDWYEWIRVSGYWFLDNADDSSSKKWEPPAGMLDFIDKAHADGKKVVYIGFGSIVVSDPDAMTDCVVQSVLDSDVRAILSKGWSDRLSVKKDNKPKNDEADKAEEQYPPEIFSVSSVPHDWLFSRIDAACHHGGAGTTGASLRAGIPTIIKPFFGDQFFWADRVEVLGVGSSVRKLTKDHLTEALKTATQDIKQIDKAKLIGEEIRAENGVDNAIQAIYRDLEYSKSLVKRPDQAESSSASSPSMSPSVPLRKLPSSSLAMGHSPTLSQQSGSSPARGGDSDESWDVVADDKQQHSSGRSKNAGLGLVGTVLGGLTGGLSNGLSNKSKEKRLR